MRTSFNIQTAALALPLLMLGCKSAPAPTAVPTAAAPAPQVTTYPPRPTIAAPAFRVFNNSQSSFTLTVKPDATNEEIEALIWQLRDATRTRTLDKIKISQKAFDATGSNIPFHLYRGTRCASEKYAPGPPPCGASYHAAGDYTYSNTNNAVWDSGVLRDNDHEIRLWNPDAPYQPSTK